MQPLDYTASVVVQRSDERLLEARDAIVTVDGIKANVFGITKKQLYQNPYLSFQTNRNRKTKKVYKDWATYNGATFTIKPYYDQEGRPGEYRIILSFSPHVYANEGRHNADNLTLGRLLWVFYDLQKRFEIDLSKCFLFNLETGLNLITNGHWPPHTLDSVIIHKFRGLNHFDIDGSNGRMAVYSQHILKLYDKGQQYTDYSGTLRFEDRFIKADRFNQPFGIITLSDLCLPVKLAKLANHLVGFWEEVLVFDVALKQEKFLSQFAHKKQIEILKWADPDHWEKLQKRTRGSTKNRYYREKARFAEFHAKHSTMKEDIANEIADKIAPLLAFAQTHDALNWEDMLCLATKHEIGKAEKLGKNDRFQSPAIVAARKSNEPFENLRMGKNDLPAGPQQIPLKITEVQTAETQHLGKSATILKLSEFPCSVNHANQESIDWDSLDEPEIWDQDAF